MKRHFFNLFAVALLLMVTTVACNKDKPATGLALNPSIVMLVIDGTATLTATIYPHDAVDQTVTWISDNNAVATVANGKVTAIAAGTATITATVVTIEGNSFKATSKVIVTHPAEPEMVKVKGGTFTMGCSDDECYPFENPQRQVTLSDFRMAVYPVTQKQWKLIMDNNPSFTIGDNLPVEQVSWNDVQNFITKLNEVSGKNYRLATEAEWEYAARGGDKSQGYKYSGSNDINEVAWHAVDSSSRTQPVGMKKPNELGIYDMSGNVFEWVHDWYRDRYPSFSEIDPTGPATGGDFNTRVLRGGSWSTVARGCRVSFRISALPTERLNLYGFRLVLPEPNLD